MEFPIRTTVRTLDTRLAHHRPQLVITKSSGDPLYEPQLKECPVFILHPERQLKGYHSKSPLKECHMFTLHPEPQLKGYNSEPQLKECSSKVHP